MAAKHKMHCIGFVVGIHYKTDGQEWLTNKNKQLVRLQGVEDAFIYHKENDAKTAAEQIAKTHAGLGQVFYRAYFYGTTKPVSQWPKGMKQVKLPEDHPVIVIIN